MLLNFIKKNTLYLFILFIVSFYTINTNTPKTFHDLICNILPLRTDGKINIPPEIKHIKIDIGLSYSAPMSQQWLSHEEDLYVFGFEPNPSCIDSILQGAIKQAPFHGDPLEKKFINKCFFLIPCALGLPRFPPAISFFITKDDCGCSSIYPPKYFDVEKIISVPIFSLADFFDVFPFDTHPIIDYIKIDAQGSDLDIVKSAKNYLSERVIYITIEPENTQYQNTTNSVADIHTYMKTIGFIPYQTSKTSDPTYVNSRYLDYLKTHTVTIYQNG